PVPRGPPARDEKQQPRTTGTAGLEDPATRRHEHAFPAPSRAEHARRPRTSQSPQRLILIDGVRVSHGITTRVSFIRFRLLTALEATAIVAASRVSRKPED